jgi:hypothetical protein
MSATLPSFPSVSSQSLKGKQEEIKRKESGIFSRKGTAVLIADPRETF